MVGLDAGGRSILEYPGYPLGGEYSRERLVGAPCPPPLYLQFGLSPGILLGIC